MSTPVTTMDTAASDAGAADAVVAVVDVVYADVEIHLYLIL